MGKMVNLSSKATKYTLDYMQSTSLSGIVNQVNDYNNDFSHAPLLRDDIVKLVKEDGTFILLYYK